MAVPNQESALPSALAGLRVAELGRAANYAVPYATKPLADLAARRMIGDKRLGGGD